MDMHGRNGMGPCGEAWRLARELAGEATATAPRVAPAARRRNLIHPPWFWWRLAAAAAMVTVAALVIQVLQTNQRPPPVYRDAGDEQKAEIVSLLPAGESVSHRACILTWKGPRNARYDIWVSDEDLDILAQARDLEAPSYQVPVDSLSDLPSGSRLFWRLEAVLKDQRRISSRTFTTTLKDP
ncbi:MAG: hypothetical protein ACE5ID_08185 [Acidobacteriota bacterium]